MNNKNDISIKQMTINPKWDKEEISDDSLGLSFKGIDDPEFHEIKEILEGQVNISYDPRITARLNQEKEALNYFRSKGVFNPSHFLLNVFGVRNISFRVVFYAIAHHKSLMDKLCLNYTLKGKLRINPTTTKKTKI